jgi:hypothetical protein
MTMLALSMVGTPPVAHTNPLIKPDDQPMETLAIAGGFVMFVKDGADSASMGARMKDHRVDHGARRAICLLSATLGT